VKYLVHFYDSTVYSPDRFFQVALCWDVRVLLQSRHQCVSLQDELYVLLYANSSWYLFIRLYHMFCQRLRDIRRIADARQRETSRSLESSCQQLLYYVNFMPNMSNFYNARCYCNVYYLESVYVTPLRRNSIFSVLRMHWLPSAGQKICPISTLVHFHVPIYVIVNLTACSHRLFPGKLELQQLSPTVCFLLP